MTAAGGGVWVAWSAAVCLAAGGVAALAVDGRTREICERAIETAADAGGDVATRAAVFVGMRQSPVLCCYELPPSVDWDDETELLALPVMELARRSVPPRSIAEPRLSIIESGGRPTSCRVGIPGPRVGIAGRVVGVTRGDDTACIALYGQERLDGRASAALAEGRLASDGSFALRVPLRRIEAGVTLEVVVRDGDRVLDGALVWPEEFGDSLDFGAIAVSEVPVAVSGRIVDGLGHPVPYASVLVEPPGARNVFTRSDMDGRFVVRARSGPGLLAITIQHGRGGVVERVVFPGSALEITMPLVAIIVGSAPPEHREGRIVARRSDGNGRVEGGVGNTGEFRLHGLTPGRWSFTHEGPHGVRVLSEGVDVPELPANRSLRLDWTDPDGN